MEGLESLLYGAAINQWQVTCYGLDPEDPYSFDDALDKWKKKKNLNYSAMKDQLDYFGNVCKPREFTPEESTARLHHINLMIPEFIDATKANMLTDEAIKDIIYKAMPRGWKTNYINSGKKIHEETLESIERYMSTQQTSEENEGKKKNNKSQNNNNNYQKHGGAQSAKKDHGRTTMIQDGTIIIIIIAEEIIIITTTQTKIIIIIIQSPDQKWKNNAQSMLTILTSGANAG